MRIAYLTARYPFPPIGGDRMRAYYTLRFLLQSHEVTLYTIAPGAPLNGQNHHPDCPGLHQKIFPVGKGAFVWNGVAALLSPLPLQTRLYDCPALVQALDEDIQKGNVDLLFVHLIRMAEYVRSYSHLPRILDMADSISLHYKRMRKVFWDPLWVGTRIDRSRVFRYEAEVPKWFDTVLLHTQEDIDWVQRQSGTKNLVQSRMGVDTEEFAFQEGPFNPRRIVYCSKLDYLPNIDAAVYFATEVFPLVRRRIQDAEFSIVGFNPPKSVRTLARMPGVDVRANVPDVRPEVTSAAVSVAPIRFGAGIQNKILQALAMGVPVVATPLVARPFGLGAGSPVLSAETPEKFADHVVKILQHPEYRRHLALVGRELIETHFKWDQVFAPVDQFLNGITGMQNEAGAKVCATVGPGKTPVPTTKVKQ